MRRRTTAVLGGALALAMAAANAPAADGIAFSAGRAGKGDETDIAKLSLVWNWQKQWAAGRDWVVGGYWEASFGIWSGDSTAGGNKDVAAVEFKPVFRLREATPAGVSPYAEFGIGLALLSDSRIHARKDMGSDYHFASHIGLGLRFGEKGRFELGYRFEHYSNAGIERPNPGIDFHLVRLQYHF